MRMTPKTEVKIYVFLPGWDTGVQTVYMSKKPDPVAWLQRFSKKIAA